MAVLLIEFYLWCICKSHSSHLANWNVHK